MGGERLRHRFRGADLDSGRPRRSAWRQANVHRRLRPLHPGFGRLCRCAESALADCRTGGPGRRCGDAGAQLARSAEPCLSGSKCARPSGRRLGGRGERGSDSRPARRRRADRAGRLAGDLPGQRADRPGGALADLALCRRDAHGGRPAARSSGTGGGDSGVGNSRRRDDRGRQTRLAEPPRAGRARRGRRPRRAVRAAGAPGRAAHAAASTVQGGRPSPRRR